jgi:hypothetical protein
MFLIALVKKLMPEIQLTVTVFSMQQIILKMVWHQLFRWSNNCGVSGKKKMILLLGILVLWVIKWLLP